MPKNSSKDEVVTAFRRDQILSAAHAVFASRGFKDSTVGDIADAAGIAKGTLWALTSYLVANAVILPLTGWLATVFGRKRLLIVAVVGFSFASLLCGLAPTLVVLIVF